MLCNNRGLQTLSQRSGLSLKECTRYLEHTQSNLQRAKDLLKKETRINLEDLRDWDSYKVVIRMNEDLLKLPDLAKIWLKFQITALLAGEHYEAVWDPLQQLMRQEDATKWSQVVLAFLILRLPEDQLSEVANTLFPLNFPPEALGDSYLREVCGLSNSEILNRAKILVSDIDPQIKSALRAGDFHQVWQRALQAYQQEAQSLDASRWLDEYRLAFPGRDLLETLMRALPQEPATLEARYQLQGLLDPQSRDFEPFNKRKVVLQKYGTPYMLKGGNLGKWRGVGGRDYVYRNTKAWKMGHGRLEFYPKAC